MDCGEEQQDASKTQNRFLAGKILNPNPNPDLNPKITTTHVFKMWGTITSLLCTM